MPKDISMASEQTTPETTVAAAEIEPVEQEKAAQLPAENTEPDHEASLSMSDTSIDADTQPTEIDSEPTEINIVSTEADSKSAEADTQPVEVDSKPAEADVVPIEIDAQSAEADSKPTQAQAKEKPVNVVHRKKIKVPSIWQWLIILIVLGVLIVGIVSSITGYWIRSVHLDGNPTPTQIPTTVLKVQRGATYAGLSMTVVDARYATYFSDDNIRSGQGTIRLNMHVGNTSRDRIKIVYYDNARLLAPDMDPIAPSNLSLSAGPDPGKSENGWIDFSVPKTLSLDKLTLQLGDTRINESLAKIPFTGNYDPNRYNDKVVKQDLQITYEFVKAFVPYDLSYHLTGVEVRYAYQGTQCKAGQQFYIFNFTVDNPSGKEIDPGEAFAYLRLDVNGYNQPPAFSTLAPTFKPGAKGISGQTVFAGPANMHGLNLIFLRQYSSQQQNYNVNV